jgi:SAM-dependent methyltransferase
MAKSSYPSLDFRVADILTLREAENFDAVWMAYSFLHIPKASAANLVRSIGRLIKPGGVFFVETSIADATREEVRPIAGLTDGAGRKIEVPYTFWTVAELNDLLQPAFAVEWSKSYTPDDRPPPVWAGIMRRGPKKL